jgi:hypothetical protein
VLFGYFQEHVLQWLDVLGGLKVLGFALTSPSYTEDNVIRVGIQINSLDKDLVNLNIGRRDVVKALWVFH